MNNNAAVTNHKKWLLVTLAAAALTLSACGKKDDSALQSEPGVDAQTSVEQEATGVATANDDVAVASANDGMASADMTNDDVAVATADDSEIIDGTESEEHVSTY
ncbi:hypothetical protein ES754_08665 [Psychrobacter frigidicola]|uniref:Lipoprotein n=2 Tax=Psychrobacter frigidicola TaxID=45611 RepID=A0A5C7A3T0_9GAMM|nr:hypothetical protein ES754_08665 [Psychrobacter frigidicola]